MLCADSCVLVRAEELLLRRQFPRLRRSRLGDIQWTAGFVFCPANKQQGYRDSATSRVLDIAPSLETRLLRIWSLAMHFLTSRKAR
jgi:hypothetical protein